MAAAAAPAYGAQGGDGSRPFQLGRGQSGSGFGQRRAGAAAAADCHSAADTAPACKQRGLSVCQISVKLKHIVPLSSCPVFLPACTQRPLWPPAARLVLESVIFQELFDKLELSNFEIASGGWVGGP